MERKKVYVALKQRQTPKSFLVLEYNSSYPLLSLAAQTLRLSMAVLSFNIKGSESLTRIFWDVRVQRIIQKTDILLNVN